MFSLERWTPPQLDPPTILFMIGPSVPADFVALYARNLIPLYVVRECISVP